MLCMYIVFKWFASLFSWALLFATSYRYLFPVQRKKNVEHTARYDLMMAFSSKWMCMCRRIITIRIRSSIYIYRFSCRIKWFRIKFKLFNIRKIYFVYHRHLHHYIISSSYHLLVRFVGLTRLLYMYISNYYIC